VLRHIKRAKLIQRTHSQRQARILEENNILRKNLRELLADDPSSGYMLVERFLCDLRRNYF